MVGASAGAENGPMDPIEIRPYRPEDEDPWLRCRALSFLYTAYFDDVDPVRPTLREPSVELVATVDDVLVGIVDAEIEGGVATIDTIAVHPDHQGRGVGRLLFQALRDRSREAGAHTIDAWTRDDPGTLAWYRAMGFTDHDHYLHVIADREEAGHAASPSVGFSVAGALVHADLADEARMRARFRRVHVCRRFTRPVDPPS